MSELKTQKNDASVEVFLNSVENVQKWEDSFEILSIMRWQGTKGKSRGFHAQVISIYRKVENTWKLAFH